MWTKWNSFWILSEALPINWQIHIPSRYTPASDDLSSFYCPLHWLQWPFWSVPLIKEVLHVWLESHSRLETFYSICWLLRARTFSMYCSGLHIQVWGLGFQLEKGGLLLSQVEEFKYLGVFTSETRNEHEIDRQIGAAAAVMVSVWFLEKQ